MARETQLGPQPWPWLERPRVLIENPDDKQGLACASVLRRAGYSVAVCPGPVESHRPPGRCPLIGSDGCSLVDGADVIVSSLGLETAHGRQVVRALRRLHPGTPLVVEVEPEDLGRYRDVVEGCRVLESPASPETLLAAVRESLAG